MTTYSELITSTKDKSQWRESLWMVTINTNKSYKSRDVDQLDEMPALKEKFKQFLVTFFAKERLYKCLVDLGKEGKKVDDGKPVDKDSIKNIEAHIQMEAVLDGDHSTGKLHAHISIKCVHNSRLMINVPLIRRVSSHVLSEFLVKKDGEPGWTYVSATGRNTAYNSENYVKSGVAIN